MKLAHEFLRLPLQFDAERLREEALGFGDDAWEYHPQGYAGNSALLLVSAHGEQNNDYSGPMQATPALAQCRYIQQALAAFDTVIGRCRLMRLDPHSAVPAHSDTHYSWKHRLRIHIPVVTDERVIFSSVGNHAVHMQAGEAWVFDNWKQHAVRNDSDVQRIHLVIDTTGSSAFWQLVSHAWRPGTPQDDWQAQVKFIAPSDALSPRLKLERFNSIPVMPPAEIDEMTRDFLIEIRDLQSTSDAAYQSIADALAQFRQDWRSTWSLYADSREGHPYYTLLMRDLRKTATAHLGEHKLAANDSAASEVLAQWLDSALDPGAEKRKASQPAAVADTSLFDCPIFIVAAPRSGSTMLFEILQQNMELWTIGDESHVEIESIRQLHPASHNFASNSLSAADATPEVSARLVGTFMRKLQNSQGTAYLQLPAQSQSSSIRFLEKTPKNALRIPFLHKIFPNALFIFLHRNPQQNIGSIVDAWKSGRFVTYPNLPGWSGMPWSLLLPPGWRELHGKSLEEIAVHQWQQANQAILHDLAAVPHGQWCAVRYEDLLNDRETQLRRLCEFAMIPFGPRMQALSREEIPLSKYTLSKPDAEKWQRYRTEIERLLPRIAELQHSIEDASAS